MGIIGMWSKSGLPASCFIKHRSEEVKKGTEIFLPVPIKKRIFLRKPKQSCLFSRKPPADSYRYPLQVLKVNVEWCSGITV